jgi:hypothetical protein
MSSHSEVKSCEHVRTRFDSLLSVTLLRGAPELNGARGRREPFSGVGHVYGVPAHGAGGRGLHSSTFQLNLSRFGHTPGVPLFSRLGGNNAPNVSNKLCVR